MKVTGLLSLAAVLIFGFACTQGPEEAITAESYNEALQLAGDSDRLAIIGFSIDN